MKINIFYSWQSDLPNNSNRSFIENQIKQSVNVLTKELLNNFEFIIESDSRNETGTPDLAQSIFEKINKCHIFIADISIINKDSKYRLVPNPNVLIELGYAAKVLGWSKIICVFNQNFAEVENLPFDIRGRKPILYNSNNENNEEKKKLGIALKNSIKNIINESYLDNKEYVITKRTVDLGMQSILIDLCQFLFYDKKTNIERYNYQKLLDMTQEHISCFLSEKTFLGFFIWRNIKASIKDFIGFFNDKLETYFLSDMEKRLIAKMVYAIREYNNLLEDDSRFKKTNSNLNYKIVKGTDFNPNNHENSYLLIEPLNDNKAVVIASGKFENVDLKNLLNDYALKENCIQIFSSIIYSIKNNINDWIRQTGKYFIVDLKEN